MLEIYNEKMATLEAELATPAPTNAGGVGLTDRWVDGLAAHLEQQIFFAGMVGTVGCWPRRGLNRIE